MCVLILLMSANIEAKNGFVKSVSLCLATTMLTRNSDSFMF